MAKSKLRILLPICALALALLLAGVCVLAFRPVTAREADVQTEVQFKTVYTVGETVTIPANRLKDGEGYVDARSYVTLPDGSVVAADTFVVQAPGLYSVEYRAMAGGKLLSKKYTLRGADNLYSFSGDNSYATYGISDRVEAEGLNVALAQRETLTFHRVIDLSDSRQTDGLLKLIFTPDVQGVCDADNLTVHFTDAYDPSNVVSVIARRVPHSGSLDHWTNFSTFVAAKGPNQRYTGIEQRDKGTTVIYNGEIYSLHVNDAYGYPALVSMSGVPLQGTRLEDHPFELDWDYSQRQIFSSPSDVNTSRMVTDLDELLFYSTLWNGFTTGEVYISFEGSNYNASLSHFLITELDGWDLSDNSFLDEQAPNIHVDSEGYSLDDVPNAVAGKPYRVFSATAEDAVDGEVAVRRYVYYNYSSDMRSLVAILGGEDTSFTPPFEGEFAIVYLASDRSGKEARVVVPVTAVSAENTLGITLGEHLSGHTAGSEIEVASVSVQNSIGAVDTEITASLQTDDSVVYRVSSDGTFVPLYSGTYTIDYKVSDYISEVTASYTLEVQAPAGQVFIEQPAVPAYFIKGMKYDLPQVSAYTLSDETPQPSAVQITVSENGGEAIAADGGYTPAEEGMVSISYRPQSGDPLVFERPVADVGYFGRMDIGAYFYGDVDKTSGEDGVLLTSDSDAYFDFINPLATIEFSANMQIPEEYSSYGALKITLTDSLDPHIAVDFLYRNEGGILQFSINGETPYSLGAFGTASLSLSFDDAARTVQPVPGIFLSVGQTNGGEEFAGFPSKLAYVRFTFCEVETLAGVNVSSLNGQQFGGVTTDLVLPVIYGTTERGERAVGDIVTLSPTYAADVLDPNIVFTLKVYDPDNAIVTDLNGVVLDGTAPPQGTYSFRLEKMGLYRAIYTATDGSNNRSTFSCSFTVIDTVPPELELSGKYATTAKRGDSVTVAACSAKDNIDENIAVYVTVKTPDSRIVFLGDAGSFRAELSGEYRVTYSAYDRDGNMSSVSYTVQVK